MKNTIRLPLVAALALLLVVSSFADSDPALAQAKNALARNDLATAEQLLVPLATAPAPDAAACAQLGEVRQRQGRFADAVTLFERVTQLEPRKPEGFASLGIAISQRMSQVSMLEQAMLAMKLKKAFAKAVELDPNHVPGLIGLARFYTNAPEIAGGSLEKARELAERVKKISPLHGELELGVIAESAEDYATAANHYSAAVQAGPTNTAALTSAARALTKLGRREEARTHLETALKLDPANTATQQALAGP